MSKIITLDRLSDFLTNLKGLFVTKTDANSTYATKEELNSAKTTADDTYETKTDAATHLTKIDAETTYATKTELTTAENNASNTYLSKTDAADTYATKKELNTSETSEVVHKSGDETIAGTKTFSNGVLSTAPNAFMAQRDGYTLVLRNDGGYTYLLMSDKDGVPGTWSNARPLTISNSTGVCDINGNASTATTATYASRSANNGGFYISGYLVTIG